MIVFRSSQYKKKQVLIFMKETGIGFIKEVVFKEFTRWEVQAHKCNPLHVGMLVDIL